MSNRFSGKVRVFHGLRLHEKAAPAGYAAVIDAYALAVPLPYRMCCIGESHTMKEEGRWRYFTPRYAPSPNLEDHLLFALKYEGVDLAVLKALFSVVEPAKIEEIVSATPTGSYVRRLWFLYEWLMDRPLELPDLSSGNYVPVIDPNLQYAVSGKNIKRQRV